LGVNSKFLFDWFNYWCLYCYSPNSDWLYTSKHTKIPEIDPIPSHQISSYYAKCLRSWSWKCSVNSIWSTLYGIIWWRKSCYSLSLKGISDTLLRSCMCRLQNNSPRNNTDILSLATKRAFLFMPHKIREVGCTPQGIISGFLKKEDHISFIKEEDRFVHEITKFINWE
jgi:hypothetical protein